MTGKDSEGVYASYPKDTSALPLYKEAREAHIGIAGGVDEALLFRRGEIVAKYPTSQIVDILIDELKNMKKESQNG